MKTRALLLLISIVICTGKGWASSVAGSWAGSFDVQATRPTRDKSGQKKNFTLVIKRRGRSWAGILAGDEIQPRQQSISNEGWFGDRFCFDALDDDNDMRWCVAADRNRLSGVWSLGPKGGRLLDGMGAGARLFAIRGTRLKH